MSSNKMEVLSVITDAPSSRNMHVISCMLFKNFSFYIGLSLIYNVVLASGVQQSDSLMHISILFQILFPFRLLQNIKQRSLCYTVGPCWLTILYIYSSVYMLIPNS